MSLDRRVREGIDRLTSEIDPDVERQLGISVRRGRRRVRVRRATAATAVLATAVVVAVFGPSVLESFREPSPAPIAPPVTAESLQGTYRAVVPDASGVVREQGLAGEWIIQFLPDGRLRFDAPDSYRGGLMGFSYRVDGGRIRTDAFVNDLCNEAQGAGFAVGTFTADERAGRLTLAPEEDVCPGRVAILSSATLERVR
jgi:hypothetical protein